MNYHASQASYQASRAWPDADVELLRDLWGSGNSASVCAEAIGGRSRNSIIGMVHRLGLPKRKTKVVGRQISPAKPSKLKAPRLPAPALIAPPVVVYAPLPRTAAWEPLPGTEPVRLMELDRGMCKWPVTVDRPWLFCGAHTDGIYCATHKAMSVMGVKA